MAYTHASICFSVFVSWYLSKGSVNSGNIKLFSFSRPLCFWLFLCAFWLKWSFMLFYIITSHASFTWSSPYNLNLWNLPIPFIQKHTHYFRFHIILCIPLSALIIMYYSCQLIDHFHSLDYEFFPVFNPCT